MSWASERQTLILSIVGVVILTIVALVAVATFYDAPSCADGKQNQDEQGVDCGGSCAYLCNASVSKPIVSFARAIAVSGRTDVVAYVENPNPRAAVAGARFSVDIFGTDHSLLGTVTGQIDLLPGALVPIYLPSAVIGSDVNAQAFLSFDDTTLDWFTYSPLPTTVTVRDVKIVGSDAPRVTAMIENNTARAVKKVKLIATVFDAAGNAIAASQTVLLDIAPFTNANAVFTWNLPFSASPARVDVRPVVPISGL